MRLKDKVAVITGGGSGIGAATARLFTAEGARVVVTGRRLDVLQQVASEIDALAVAGDTADREDIARIVSETEKTLGPIDAVIACAGIAPAGGVIDVGEEDWQTTLDVNLSGPMFTSRAVLPGMLERGSGAFVFISSTAGLAAAPSSVAYDVSKAGLIALARGIAVDYGDRGIRANSVVPGWVRTPMGDRSMDALAEEKGITREQSYDLATTNVPMRRAATPEEIASCCLFLASDEARYVTGTTLVADGGGLAVEMTSVDFTFGGQSG